MSLIEEISQDFPDTSAFRIGLKYFASKGMQAVILYRISSYMYQKGHYQIAKFVKNKSIRQTGADIGEAAVIGSGFSIGHPVGLVIGGCVTLGKNNFFLSGVTLGSANREVGGGRVITGDNVYFGSGAKVIGNITIGNNVKIGANAVVINDVPDYATCVGIPGRNIIQ